MTVAKKHYAYSEFGTLLRKQRKQMFGDIKSFSFATNIPPKDLYGYESGRTFPPIEKFVKICTCLDKSATYMLSPILKLDQSERQIVHLVEDKDFKEMIRDEKLSTILISTLIGFQILYQSKKHLGHEGSAIDYLNIIMKKLFYEDQPREKTITRNHQTEGPK
jgi:hypothetical protein